MVRPKNIDKLFYVDKEQHQSTSRLVLVKSPIICLAYKSPVVRNAAIAAEPHAEWGPMAHYLIVTM